MNVKIKAIKRKHSTLGPEGTPAAAVSKGAAEIILEPKTLMTPDFSQYAIDSLWLDPTPKPRTLLVMYPHPDDESLSNGGTIARYVAQGVAVHYA
jgi:hypothetical protein